MLWADGFKTLDGNRDYEAYIDFLNLGLKNNDEFSCGGARLLALCTWLLHRFLKDLLSKLLSYEFNNNFAVSDLLSSFLSFVNLSEG